MNHTANPVSTCCVCHDVISSNLRRPWTLPDGSPVCIICLSSKSYSEANSLRVGAPDGLPAFSVEFEVCTCTIGDYEEERRAWMLLKYGFLRTDDKTVDAEYKSPIYQSLAAFEPVLPAFQRLGNLVDRCCGTHIHISCPRKCWVPLHAGSIFGPLRKHWADHPQETLAFWGRNEAPCRGNILTDTRYNTVEFRLPRFRSAAQYLDVAQYCRQAGNVLNTCLANAESISAFARVTPRLGEELLALYQQVCATALATPTWKVRPPFLFVRL